MLKEIGTFYRDGVTDDELNYMRSAASQQEALSYETPAQKSGFLMQLLLLDLDPGYVERQSDIIASIGKGELARLAKSYLAVTVDSFGSKSNTAAGT